MAIDHAGTIIDWNSAAERLLGWSRAEILGRPLADTLIPPALREVFLRGIARLHEGGAAPADGRRVDYAALARDGTEIPVEITLWATGTGDRIRFNAFLRDLRERQQADQFRRLMAAIVESSEDAILTKSLRGFITSWNPGAERLLGYTADEAIGQHITMLFPQDRIHEEAEILSRLTRGERVEHFETVRVTKDGRQLHVALTISPVRNAAGQIIGASKILRDITSRREVEGALAEERRLLQELNQASGAMASTVELPKLLQTITDAATKICGAEFGAFFYNEVSATGESYRLVTLSGAAKEDFERLGQPRATPIFAPTFEGKGAVRLDDVTADPRFGQWAPHHGMPKGHLPVRSYLAVPVKSRAGEVLGGLFFGHGQVGVFGERHERFVSALAAHASIAIENARLFEERKGLLESERAARSQAERFNASKDDFLSTLSHELRTPLNNIFGWTQILKGARDGDGDVAKAVDVIERNVRLQTQLVDDLLDMSRIVSGQMRIDVQTIMPMSFVKAAVESLAPAADSRKIRIQTALDPNAGPVSGDPGRLQQVVWNLVSNAIKFTPNGGKVQVALERVNSHIEISVTDTGVGIKPEFLPHVFERFTQADASITRKQGGLGLGLAIVKHIVELHSGQVHAKSPGQGQGTTFRVLLPVAAIHRNEDAERRHPRSTVAVSVATVAANIAGVKVLAVDDEPDSRDLIRRVLSDAGAIVTLVSSAQEALATLAQSRPDVLVSDIGMPEVDGYEMLRRARAAGTSVPAIALTAFARSEDRTRAMLAGYLAHIAKPVEPSELIATVASVAGRIRS